MRNGFGQRLPAMLLEITQPVTDRGAAQTLARHHGAGRLASLRHAPNRRDTNMFKRIVPYRSAINACPVALDAKTIACSLYECLVINCRPYEPKTRS